ncbi:MAG: L,D-transpeptidase, partial [Actinomycetota bacterium]
LVVIGVSACSAVAADRLPGATTTDVRTAPAAPTADPSPVAFPPAAAVPAVALPSASTGRASGEPQAPAAPSRPTAQTATTPPRAPAAAPPGTDGSTIVATAVAASVVARVEPSDRSEAVADFTNPTDRGGPLVFQALGQPEDGWLEVLLPIRPNGTTGWIRLDEVELSRNPYRIEVDLDRFEITVERNGEVEIAAPVAIGQGGTPTPVGDFFLIELLQPPEPDGPYGSYAYGLSGYSDVLERFNGGEGVIGIHGTNQPDLLGGPASHGCIRVHNDTIEAMAEFLPLGTPVSIVGEVQTVALLRWPPVIL